jgi:hypothetical protein
MMRCLQCERDYPEPQRFCHQCGEPLQPRDAPAALDHRVARGAPRATLRRTPAISRRRAPQRSSSPLFATLIVLAAAAGLAVVWRQAWLPLLPRVAVSVDRPPQQDPPKAVDPTPTLAAVPVEPEAAAPAPPATPEPEPPPAAAPLPLSAPAAEPAPAVSHPPPPKRAAEPAAPKVASRPDSPPAPDRSSSDAPPRQSGTATKLVNARPESGTPLPSGAARVISLVAVGAGAGARGQLLWEPMGGGTLVVSGLPQPPAGRTYQLWLGSINLGSRVSAGLLAVDAQGAGTLRVAPPRATWSPDIFGVTMERQGGARQPSDDLVLVGELSKTAPAAPGAATPPSSPATEPGAGPASQPGREGPSSSVSKPTVTASLPPAPSRGPDGELVRVFPARMERTWTVAQSVLKSLGWDIDRADQATGVIRTEPRNVTFKDFVVYAEGTRHTLDVVVRAVSDTETSISVRREVFEEQRIFWTKERKTLATPESSVEQSVLDAIERVL